MLHQSFSNAHDLIHIKGEHLIQANNDIIFHLKKIILDIQKKLPLLEKMVYNYANARLTPQ